MNKADGNECEFCDGTGKMIPNCETCEGKGWVNDPSDGGTMSCPVCDNEDCDICHGTGESE